MTPTRLGAIPNGRRGVTIQALRILVATLQEAGASMEAGRGNGEGMQATIDGTNE